LVIGGVIYGNNESDDYFVKSHDDARSLVSSPDLAQAMTDAGVLGKPQIWLTEKR
jgi:hypothetical protein